MLLLYTFASLALANDQAIQEFKGRLLLSAPISNENVPAVIELQNINSTFNGCWMTGDPKMQNGQFTIEPSTIECNDKKYAYVYDVKQIAIVSDIKTNTTSLTYTHDAPSKNAIALYKTMINDCEKIQFPFCKDIKEPSGLDYIKKGSVVKVVISNKPILISKKPRLTSIQDIR